MKMTKSKCNMCLLPSNPILHGLFLHPILHREGPICPPM